MESTRSTSWRYGILVLLMLGSLFTVMSLEPIPQNLAYHDFADQRKFLGIPNVLDVISNLAFLLVGVLGLRYCIRADLGVGRLAWIVLFAGVSLVSVGSAYYHWAPSNETLLWDRFPMAVGFMCLFVALLGEYVNRRLPRWVLTPAVGRHSQCTLLALDRRSAALRMGSAISPADHSRRDVALPAPLHSCLAAARLVGVVHACQGHGALRCINFRAYQTSG